MGWSGRSVGVRHGGVNNFAAGGESGEHLADAILAQRAHAEFARAAAELAGGEAGVDHLAHLVIDEEQLEDAHPALETIVAAFVAADGSENGGLGDARGIQREGAHFLFGEFGRAFADGAEFPDEALGEHRAHGGGDEEGFHADVGETRDGGRRVVGVQGGENQVAGERGVDGDVGGLRIPDLTDHDDVGRLAQHGAQGRCEGHADVGLDHHLVDAGKLVFDRILHGDDLFVGFVDDVETGVKRGGLAGAGGSGD